MWNYETSVDWKQGKTGEARSAGKPAVEVATPPEFGGPENIWTPEDLLCSSVATCIMTSALFFLERSGIALRAYRSHATATMDKTSAGLAITGVKVEIIIELEDASQQEAARTAVVQAEKTCPVSNALKCPVEMSLRIEAN